MYYGDGACCYMSKTTLDQPLNMERVKQTKRDMQVCKWCPRLKHLHDGVCRRFWCTSRLWCYNYDQWPWMNVPNDCPYELELMVLHDDQ